MQPLLSYFKTSGGISPPGLALGAPDTIRLVFTKKRNSVNVDLSASIGYTTNITAAEKFHGRVDAHGSKNRSGSFFIRKQDAPVLDRRKQNSVNVDFPAPADYAIFISAV